MQGQLLELKQAKGMAKVFIQGVTEGPGFTNRWVPIQFIERSKPWQTNIDKWQVKT